MKLNLSRNELRTLLELLFVSDWMLHAHAIGRPEETKPHRDLSNKLLRYALEQGMSDYVEDGGEGEFFPTRRFETDTPVFRYIEQYDDDTFWDELAVRLADRDMEEEIAPDMREALGEAQMLELREQRYDAYLQRFENEGLHNIRLRGLE